MIFLLSISLGKTIKRLMLYQEDLWQFLLFSVILGIHKSITVRRVKVCMHNAEIEITTISSYQVHSENQLLWYGNKIWMPNNSTIKNSILHEYHDTQYEDMKGL